MTVSACCGASWSPQLWVLHTMRKRSSHSRSTIVPSLTAREMRMCTHMHTHVHVHVHVHDAHVHTLSHSHTHVQRTCMHMHTHLTCTCTGIHSMHEAHTRTRMHMHTHAHASSRCCAAAFIGGLPSQTDALPSRYF